MTDKAQALALMSRYYTPYQAARKIGFSLTFIYARIESGDIVAVRPFGGPPRIPRDWFDQHLEAMERQARESVEIDPAVKRARKRAA